MDFSKLYDSFKKISNKLRYNNLDVLNESLIVNQSNDIVIQIDKIANDIIIEFINNNSNIVGYISEENETIILKDNTHEDVDTINNDNKKYIISFDPLDGSKNVVSNITCGTIYCIMEYDSENDKITQIVESGYCLYGASTIMVIAKKNDVKMYQLDPDNNFKFIRNITSLGSEKTYHCNESYNNILDNDIKQLIQYYKNQKYSLRWIGSMVADCHQIIINGGLFIYSSNLKNPNGKIRYFYEALPLSFIFEQLGGVGLDINMNNILLLLDKIKISTTNVHKRIPIILCGKDESKNMETILDINRNIYC
jgi:fructose-1,6-bisphosphatase I